MLSCFTLALAYTVRYFMCQVQCLFIERAWSSTCWGITVCRTGKCHPTNCSYAPTAASFTSAPFHRVLIFRGHGGIGVYVWTGEVVDNGCAGCNLNKCMCGVWCRWGNVTSQVCVLFKGSPALLLCPIFYFILALPLRSYFLTFFSSVRGRVKNGTHRVAAMHANYECLL